MNVAFTSKKPGPLRRVWQAVKETPGNTSLRLQLIFVVLILMFAGLATSNLTGAAALRGYLLNRVDSQLVETAQDTFRRGQVDFGDGDQPNFRDNAPGPSLSTAFYTEVTDTNGKGHAELRVPSSSTQTAPKLPSLAYPISNKLTRHSVTVSAIGSGSNWRILVTTLPDNSGALVVGTTLSDVNNTVAQLQFIDLIVSVIVLLLLGLVGSLIVHRSLRRLSQVEETANAIAKGDMSHRAPEWSTNTEVGRLASSFNTMLERIETSFAAQTQSEADARASEERMRRFVADASHELRTPLTSIRGFAELRRQGAAATPELADHSLQRIESEAERMTLLVEDLLLLARLDQQRPLARESVDVVAIAGDIAQAAPVVAPHHPFTLDVDPTSSSLVVSGDAARLHQVILNLVNNAFTHTPPGTPVALALRAEEGNAVIEVVDSGPGMSGEEAARVFERFYRADPSRVRSQGGSGLGLSIVAGIVDAHKGTLAVESAPGEGAKFTVRLPLLTSSPDQSAEQETSSDLGS